MYLDMTQSAHGLLFFLKLVGLTFEVQKNLQCFYVVI